MTRCTIRADPVTVRLVRGLVAMAIVDAVLAAGCGRLGFTDTVTADDATDAASDSDTNTGTPQLSCSGPARFDVSVETVTNGMTAIATATGYAVFGVDANGGLTGSSYEFSGSTTLAQTKQTTALDATATGPLGAVGVNTAGNLLLAEQVGLPTATGTKLVPLDMQLAAMGPGTSRGDSYIGLGPVAQSPTGDVVYFAANGANSISAHAVTSLGVDTGTVVEVIPSAEASGFQEISGGGGASYLATWTNAAATPIRGRMVLLDNNFAPTVPAITTGGPGDVLMPHAVWAKNKSVYLFIWYEKNVTDGDDIYFEIRDPSLNLIGTQKLAKASAFQAVAASDGDGFLVVWDNYVPADHLEAVYIDATGAMTTRSVFQTGGKPAKWAMTQRLGQPALVWVENGGSGPNLYIDPVCN